MESKIVHCRDCWWWTFVGTDSVNGAEIGKCHFNPPNSLPGGYTWRPDVREYEWCGMGERVPDEAYRPGSRSVNVGSGGKGKE